MTRQTVLHQKAASEPHGTVDVALAHASRLLAVRPDLAAEQAIEILKSAPGHPKALLILGAAHSASQNYQLAVEVLERLCQTHGNWGSAHYELGVALTGLGKVETAIGVLRRAVALAETPPNAWLLLADHLRATGAIEAAENAYYEYIRTSSRDPHLLAAGEALHKNDIPVAEALLRERLKSFPSDVAAIRMLAEVAVRLDRLKDAENLLTRCLELAPDFAGARHNYASVLYRQNKLADALREVGVLFDADPNNPAHRNLKAAILTRIGDFENAIAIYSNILAEYPNQPKIWLNYGHALKTADQEAQGITAYRRCIELSPESGEAYWSLANLKTFRFAPHEVEAMRGQIARADLSDADRFHFHFALAKALEDAKSYPQSFEHYAEGNRLRRSLLAYDADEMSALTRRSRALFTREFWEERQGTGCDAPDPIFIVGLPRAGSTLIEQILSSHSAVEGTMELPDLPQIARELRTGRSGEAVLPYPDLLADLGPEDFREIGERYLRQTRIQRRTSAQYFIDKMPNNFTHIGLILLALPNAKIIDARRHPLGCCFSVFKQHFARGQKFAYSFDDIGRYYRDYVELMNVFDSTRPGAVHRIFYERMIGDTESEVMRLLDYCGLPFEENCLRFYENQRLVRTASSQQVRQPIFREGLEQWRRYEPWLGALKQTLADVLTAYPNIPDFNY